MVLKQRPRDAIALLNKGNALHRLGNTDDAIKRFKKILEREPYHVNAINGMGTSYMGKHRFLKAIRYFDQAIGLDPKHKYTWYNKGTCLFRLNRLEDLGLFVL
jgi:tetratricopeptide (TPR) repeat protein